MRYSLFLVVLFLPIIVTKSGGGGGGGGGGRSGGGGGGSGRIFNRGVTSGRLKPDTLKAVATVSTAMIVMDVTRTFATTCTKYRIFENISTPIEINGTNSSNVTNNITNISVIYNISSTVSVKTICESNLLNMFFLALIVVTCCNLCFISITYACSKEDYNQML